MNNDLVRKLHDKIRAEQLGTAFDDELEAIDRRIGDERLLRIGANQRITALEKEAKLAAAEIRTLRNYALTVEDERDAERATREKLADRIQKTLIDPDRARIAELEAAIKHHRSCFVEVLGGGPVNAGSRDWRLWDALRENADAPN